MTQSASRPEPVEVGMLLSPPDENRRVASALARAGYRPVVPTNVLDWATRQQHTVVVTTDGTQSLGLLRRVMDAGIDARAVVLVQTPGTARYRELFRHCTAALPAGSADADVVVAVKAALRALSCLPAQDARALTGALGEPAPSLNDKELSWLRALADGVTVASLARASGYSPREMYRLLAELYRRLGVDTRTEALLLADRHGLLRPPVTAVPRPRRRPASHAPAERPMG